MVHLCCCKFRTQKGLWNRVSSRLNARWQTDWANEDQAKTWTRQPIPMISEHSAHSTPLPFGILALVIYMFVVINFDALAQASDFRIERRQVVFLCWMQDWNPRRVSGIESLADLVPAYKPTDELSRIKLKLELDSPSLWSASIQPTRPHCLLAFAPGSGDIHVCCCFSTVNTFWDIINIQQEVSKTYPCWTPVLIPCTTRVPFNYMVCVWL